MLPIAAVIGQPTKARLLWSKKINNYTEIYLKCDIEVCKNRDNKKLYDTSLTDKKKSIIGLDIPFEEPKTADIVLNSEQLPPEALLDILWEYLKKLDWFKSYQQCWSK